jgi:uncharacterized protein
MNIQLHLFRLIFLFVFLSLMYLVQRFWFVRAWRFIIAIARPGRRYMLQGLWIVAVLVLLVTSLDPILGHFIPRQGLGNWVLSVSRLWLVGSFFGFLGVTLVGGIEWLSRYIYAIPSAQRESFDPARRRFFRYAAYLAGSIPFLFTMYGFGVERLRYRIEKVEIPIADLPKSLDGLRIVQLSDIHIGDFMSREEVRRAVKMANELNADLAVLTGDLISDGSDPLEDCVSELSKLRAPLGIWGCNGNHEIYAEVEDMSQELFQRYGMRLLRQQSAELKWRGGKFNLIGVDYQREHMPFGERHQMLRGVESLVRRDIPNILLSHNPNSFYRASELGIELSLAGHTHGGQIRIEIVDHQLSPARFITKFVAGLYRLPLSDGVHSADNEASQLSPKSSFLYVNRGLGTIGMPVRLGVPPEITLITLRATG